LVLALDTMRNTTIQASVIDENQVRWTKNANVRSLTEWA
jgi:hypothetical protein